MKNRTSLFRKENERRILTLAIAVCVVFTMLPPFAVAQANNGNSGKIVLLSGFTALADVVREQSVPIGASSAELTLPDTLEAVVHSASETTPPIVETTPPPESTPPTVETTPAEESITQGTPASAESTMSVTVDVTGVTDVIDVTDVITVTGVTWESAPDFDGNAAGTYIFTAVLPSGYSLADGIAMPTITVTVEEYVQSLDDLTPEQYARYLAGENEPAPLLTEADVQAEEPELVRANAGARRTRAATNPASYLTTEDNENNAGTGQPDGDLDKYLGNVASYHPIEANVIVDKLPTQSAYLAVRTYDVNWKGLSGIKAEYDELYINGHRIGTLTGLDFDWNTSYYAVPLEYIKQGKNTVKILIRNTYMNNWGVNIDDDPCWAVKIDWMQLVCDGGSNEGISRYDININRILTSGRVVIFSATTIVEPNPAAGTTTEYSITNDKGYIVGSYQGSAAAKEDFVITMPKNSESGVYTLQGMLKKADGTILATSSVAFIFTQDVGAVIAPKMDHTLTPSELTNQSVAIAVTVADSLDCTDISIQDGGARTVAANGDYDFTVNYKYKGENKSYIYTVPVTNIDKTPPAIAYTAFSVSEDTSDAEVAALFKAALTATDNTRLAGAPTYTLPANIAATAGTKNITVTATDTVGNTATQNCTITVTPLPLSLAQNEPARVGTTSSFTLSAKLTNTGSDPITETGFVWGIMQSPTTAVNNGTAKTASAVTAKGGTITITAADIADGVNYYARPYAISGGKTFYGDQKLFVLNSKNYGSFTIANNGDKTFTISRADGSEDAQTVYYRTVNGSAVGGTHFTHAAGTVTFAVGETSKVVTVIEQSGAADYGGKPATGYANTYRIYQVEIYKVEGGGTIPGGVSRATRAMTIYEPINKSVYNQKNDTRTIDTNNNYVCDRDNKPEGGGAKDGAIFFVTDRDYNNGIGRENWSAKNSISTSYSISEAQYIKNTAQSYNYSARYIGTEKDDSWEFVWVGNHIPNTVSPPKSMSETGFNTKTKTIKTDDPDLGPAMYTGTFEIKGAGEGRDIPTTSDMAYYSYGSGQLKDSDALSVPINDTTYCWFSATGGGADIWQVDGFRDTIQVIDTKEPQLLGVAPMAGGTYKSGDSVTVSLVFDEIVDSANSSLSGVSLNTNYGTMTYAGGGDTNVLYFKGTVPEGAGGTITVSGINNAVGIKDMCNQAGTASGGSGSGSITVDTVEPGVAIDNLNIVSGTAKGKITAANHTSLKYTWSNSSTPPVSGWLTCTSGFVAQTRQTTGVWYLYAIAERSSNGTSNFARAGFDFTNPASPLPTLSLSADNSSWAHSRDIIVTRTPANAAVTYSGPQSGTASGGAVTVTLNGLYTFTLTSGGETVTEMVSVSRLDTAQPTLTLREPGGTGAVYNTLTFAGDVADNLSGVKTVEYAVTGTSTVPGSGWAALSGSGGSYNGSYTEMSAAKTIKYIHVRATDNAGNVTTKTSSAYTTVKENAAPAPVITLTGAPASWTKGPVNLTWNVTNQGAGGVTVYLNGTTDTATGGTLSAAGNGLYSVSVTDQNGVSANANLLVDKIDAEAPILTGISSPTGWGMSKTVTLTGMTDNRTPLPDATGMTTGYGGSGLKTQEWKLGSGSYTAFTGSSFAAGAAGTYTVRLTDNTGNQNEYETLVSQVDTTAPTVNIGAPASEWTNAAQSISVSYSDSESGINTAQYAIVDNTATKPTSGFSNLPSTGNSVSVSTNGTNYIYYKVTNNAGNATDGYSAAIKVDTVAPVIGTLTYSEGHKNLWDWIIGKTSLIVTVPVTENGSGADKINYAMTPHGTGNVENKTANISGGNAQIAFDKEFKGTVVISCTDRAGNVSSTVSVGKTGVIVENNAPAITITERDNKVPNADGWYNTEINLQANVKDDGISGGLAWVEKKIDDGTVTRFTNGGGFDGRQYDFTASLTTEFVDGFTTGFLTGGEHTAYFRAADNAGNESAWQTFTYKKDTKVPKINTPSLSESGYTDKDITVSVDINDSYDGSGIKSVTVTGTVGGTMTLTRQDNTYQFTTTQNDTFTITATDYADNVETLTYEVKTIDKTAPKAPTLAITSGAEGDNGWYISQVQFMVTRGDSPDVPSGTTEFAYSTDGGTTWSEWQGGTTFTLSTNGDYTGKIVAKTRSGAGTESPVSAAYGVKIDTVIPTLTVIGGETGAEQFDFAIASDFGPSGGVITVSKDGGAAQTVTDGKYTVTETGEYTMNATSGSGSSDMTNRLVYAVSFDSKGGSAVVTQLVTADGKAAVPTKPSKAGFELTAWHRVGDTVPYDFDSEVVDNISLEAVWGLSAPTIILAADNAATTYNGGTAATLTATPTHELTDAAFAYEWYKGNVKLDGKTAPTLALQTVADSGKYTVKVIASGNGLTSAQAESNAVTITIAKAPVTFAVTANEHDYNGSPKTAIVAQTAGETADVSGKFTVSYEQNGNVVASPTDVDVYNIFVELTDVNFKHENETDSTRKIKAGTLTINGITYPDADTMTWPTAADIIYGKTLSDSTLIGGNQTAKGGYAWKYGTITPTVTNSGYTVVFTPTDSNYAPVEHTVSITVAKATATLTLPAAAGITYGDTLAKSALFGGSAEAPYNGTDKAVSGEFKWTIPTTKPAVSDSGSTEYGLTFTPADTANYNVVSTGKVKLAVAQKPVGLTWAGHTALVYSGAPVSVTATAAEPVGSDVCTVTVTGGTKTDAGSYTATAAAVSNPNYKLPDNTEQAYTIAKKPIKVLWSGLFPTYDGTQKYPTLASEGVVNGEDCTVISTGSAAAGNAGHYKVAAALQGTRSANYTMQNPNEILAIQPAPVSVSLSDYSYKYDGAAKYAAVTAVPDAPLTVTYKLAGEEVTAPTEEGVYDIFVTLDGKNYRFAEGTDGKARRMGALTIYKEKPPEQFTITFASGAQDAAGTAPTLPPSVKDTVHFLPSNTFLRAGHAFVGWKNGDILYQPGERFSQPMNNTTVFTAQWEAATYDIGGVVDQDGKPVANVRVVLMRGAEQVAETVTNQIGEYRFDSVLPGLYNLVAIKPSPDGIGDIIMTIMAEVKEADIEQANITLPSGKTNSIVEVAPGTPKIIVGNLDRTFASTGGSDYTPADKEVVNKGGTVEIKFIAEEKQESEIAIDAGEITKEAGSAKIGLYLALDVEKTVTQPVNPDNPDAEPSSDTKPIPETSVLLESVIPLPGDLQGKESYTVYRVHDGRVDILTTDTHSGERIEVSGDKTTLTLYAQKFSTYAIAYTEKSSDGGGGDNGGGAGDDRPTIPNKPEQPQPPVNPTDPVKPGEGTPAPVTTPPSTKQPGTAQPDTDQPDPTRPDDKQETGGTDKAEPDITTEQKSDSGDNGAQKDDIRDALEDAIKNLPDTLTDEQRQAAIDELTRIADTAIAALDGTNDPDEAGRIVTEALEDMAKLAAEVAAAVGQTAVGKPFVVLSALSALAAVLLTAFALLKRKDKRRGLFSAIFAAFAVIAFLLTSGWSGFALANGWTPVVAAFGIAAALCVGTNSRHTKSEK